MNIHSWIEQVRDCIGNIGSRSFQERSWLGGDPKNVSSFEELMCQLYDEAVFHEFLASAEVERTLGRSLVKDLREFSKKLETYSATVPERSAPGTILRDPEWHALRDTAAILAGRLP